MHPGQNMVWCGGSLLIAAHCIAPYVEVEVVVGAHNNSATDQTGAQQAQHALFQITETLLQLCSGLLLLRF